MSEEQVSEYMYVTVPIKYILWNETRLTRVINISINKNILFRKVFSGIPDTI